MIGRMVCKGPVTELLDKYVHTHSHMHIHTHTRAHTHACATSHLSTMLFTSLSSLGFHLLGSSRAKLSPA